MKLNCFNAKTLPRQIGGRASESLPRISFSKSGVISLNKVATKLLDLSSGDKFSIAQDEDSPDNWYVFKDAENGYALRVSGYEKNGVAEFNHSALIKTFCDAFTVDSDVSYSFLVAGQATYIEGDKSKNPYYGLLISFD